MATHGLNLICAVTDEHTRQIVDFCDNLGQQLKDPDDKSAWVKLINSECALLNSPRLYPFCWSRRHRHNLKSLCQLRKMAITTRL
uniref:Uncharacterized protein n=1 Tax=Escherichia coli TaxID=562 RepID=A0A218N740_ECOLX|nr:hypothetical protein [Escherichia coli]